MELRDYGIALRRYWRTWVGLTLLGLLGALALVLVVPPTYQARAQVFVASTGDGTSGSQFVNQRVKSYPDVAVSHAVLDPVIRQLRLTDSFAALRARISSANPPDTSQIEILVSDKDPRRATDVANAVANQFGSTVEDLERPARGSSPVSLTVTDPASVPSSPNFPDPTLLLLLGGVVGLALGAAAAIARSRMDPRVHDAADLHAAWDGGDAPTILSAAGRRKPTLGRRPESMLARRLEALAEERSVRVVVVSPPGDQRLASALVDAVRAELHEDGLPVAGEPAGVELVVGTPTTSIRQWRRTAERYDGVVLAVEPGRTDRADLREFRAILAAAGLPLIAAVLDRSRRVVHRSPRPSGTPRTREADRPLPHRAATGVPAGHR